jgi:hypothetical protein
LDHAYFAAVGAELFASFRMKRRGRASPVVEVLEGSSVLCDQRLRGDGIIAIIRDTAPARHDVMLAGWAFADRTAGNEY